MARGSLRDEDPKPSIMFVTCSGLEGGLWDGWAGARGPRKGGGERGRWPRLRGGTWGPGGRGVAQDPSSAGTDTVGGFLVSPGPATHGLWAGRSWGSRPALGSLPPTLTTVPAARRELILAQRRWVGKGGRVQAATPRQGPCGTGQPPLPH